LRDGLIASLRDRRPPATPPAFRIVSLYAIARPLLFSLDPERAHELVLSLLPHPAVVHGMRLAARRHDDPRLRIDACGLSFANPLGLAAGLDKQGTSVNAWAALGFGAAEIGTVTPRPQPGNPRPRLFRLPADRALINRFGFNSDGAAAVARHLSRSSAGPMRVGVNLGRNKDTANERALDDYVSAVQALHPHADYFVVNVSSPNTAGLRDLQHGAELHRLVGAVVRGARTADPSRVIPVLVKLSPDMDEPDLFEAADAAIDAGAAGIIATNTTLSRDGLASTETLTREAGGLSGSPLRARSNAVCRALFSHLQGRVPIVGVGGIASADAAYQRIRSGATLVQVYTALIYHGPGLVHDILGGLSDRLARDGFTHLKEAVGVDAH
jgi:dihydroorotate dehydrogenase